MHLGDPAEALACSLCGGGDGDDVFCRSVFVVMIIISNNVCCSKTADTISIQLLNLMINIMLRKICRYGVTSLWSKWRVD